MARPILFVEDEPDIKDLVSLLLRSAGYEMAGAASLAEAHRVLATGPPPALVLLDLKLPDGDGLSLCPVLRERWPELPILVLTAVQLDDAIRAAATAVGCRAILSKPFDSDTLLAEIRGAIGAP